MTGKSKTELLIFLTPHVAKEPEALTADLGAERTRSNRHGSRQRRRSSRTHMDAMKDPSEGAEG